MNYFYMKIKFLFFIAVFTAMPLLFIKTANAVTIKVTYRKYTYSELIKLEKEYGGKHKAVVLRNLRYLHAQRMKKNPRLPFDLEPVGTFHGGLKKLGTVKIVFGIAGNNLQTVMETFGNIYYILKYTKLHHEKVKMAVVFYGVISLLMNDTDKTVASYIKRYSKEGVRFYVCYNAMELNNLVRAVLIPGVKPVPMGMLKLYELRKEGYMYFTNP